MLSQDAELYSLHAELIRCITQEVSHFLDNQQRFLLLWSDVDSHIAASHLAESLGNVELVKCHLQTVNRLMEEIFAAYPPNHNTLGFWFQAHAHCQPSRDLAVGA